MSKLIDIEGTEGIYKISNTGQILNVRSGKYRKLSGRNNGGYITIDLYVNKKIKYYLVHRLVAAAFVYNPNNYNSVNHKNGIKTDNNVSNLEWVTHQMNSLHGRRVLKKGVGINHGMSKLNEKEVRTIRKLYDTGIKTKKIAEEFKITVTMVHLIGKRQNWRHLSD